jgi:hypothetical protein
MAMIGQLYFLVLLIKSIGDTIPSNEDIFVCARSSIRGLLALSSRINLLG